MRAKPIFLIELPEAYVESEKEIRQALVRDTNNEYHIVIAIYNREDIKFSVHSIDGKNVDEKLLEKFRQFVVEQNYYAEEVVSESRINKK